MKRSIIQKLETMRTRFDKVNAEFLDSVNSGDSEKIRELGRERAKLEKVVVRFNRYRNVSESLGTTEAMLKDSEPELKTLICDEITRLKKARQELETEIQGLLLADDSRDERNVFLEIRAGTGGDEAAIFAGDLFRMYLRYAENQIWSVEILSISESEHGGYKEVICRIAGNDAYSKLKYESGVHRVQRVPETESQGRVHTSAATVAILPEAEEIDNIQVDTPDLRIDTFRASGAGGQHVNKTESAIRITHLPTGVSVECQDDRSQHRNKSRAIALLKARLLDIERRRQRQETAQTRRDLVGSGDRSQRIRTYNFPQGRVTDHRINLTLYQLPKLMEGDVDMLIKPLNSEARAQQLLEDAG